MTNPRTYYLTITHGWCEINTPPEIPTLHFTAERSFGPYTLTGASRIERSIHETINREWKTLFLGPQFTVYKDDTVYAGVRTRITNNWSPVTPTNPRKMRPIDYV